LVLISMVPESSTRALQIMTGSTPVSIVLLGAGLIGRERAKAIEALRADGRPVTLLGICDPYHIELEEFCQPLGVRAIRRLEDALALEADWTIVATPHDVAVHCATAALAAGRRVLLEKPLGRNMAEAEAIARSAQHADQLVVGFNYRFYEGIACALRDLREGYFGQLTSVNMILGHGGSPGDAKSWKLNPERAGGGALIDPGVHLLDLCHQIAHPSELTVAGALAWDGFWKTGIEEECHLLMRTGQCIFNVQVSVVRWRSTFRMEVHGTEGYGIVTGRGRSYGRQTYVRGRRWAWLEQNRTQAECEEVLIDTDGKDVFAAEMASLFWGDHAYGASACTMHEGLAVMKTLELCRERLTLQGGSRSS
jgi:predicted dehydrogenase